MSETKLSCDWTGCDINVLYAITGYEPLRLIPNSPTKDDFMVGHFITPGFPLALEKSSIEYSDTDPNQRSKEWNRPRENLFSDAKHFGRRRKETHDDKGNQIAEKPNFTDRLVDGLRSIGGFVWRC